MKNSSLADNLWDEVISRKSAWWSINLKEIWTYRDLLILFVKRDFVSVYKQTILGPLWFFIQPIITTLVFTLIFSKLASIPTDGIPSSLFYLAGITAWNYFADCLNTTSNTFNSNKDIFGKVYFPRLIVPLSIVISNLIKFLIQFILFLAVLFYYTIIGTAIHMNLMILLTPILILMMAGLGLGFGMIISSLTTKYRDLQFLVIFGVQLLMYGTPVVYPLSLMSEKYRWLLLLNPMTAIIETFKLAFLGAGTIESFHLIYSFLFMVVLLIIGIITFHRVEKNFMDTI